MSNTEIIGTRPSQGGVFGGILRAAEMCIQPLIVTDTSI